MLQVRVQVKKVAENLGLDRDEVWRLAQRDEVFLHDGDCGKTV